MKAVHITWVDAFSIDHWQGKDLAIEQTQKAMECQSFGFELCRTREAHVICHTVNADGSVCGVMQIPRKCIIKVDYLNELRKN